ncbi:MAG: GntR family transcriptional regulator [Dongiaceae bacterium]
MGKKANKRPVGPPARAGGASGTARADESIRRELWSAIIDHRIPPGTALPEDALSNAFGVSRTIIRKVLQRLNHERLVDIVPNKGATVAKPSNEEARQVFDARRAIERVVIERVIEHVRDQDIDALAALVADEKKAFEVGDKRRRLTLSGEFHSRLARLSGNEVLASIVTELVSRTSLIIALYELPGAVPCSHGEHLEIIDAVRRRDARKAIQYMDHHLQHIEAQIDLNETSFAVDFQKLFGAAG